VLCYLHLCHILGTGSCSRGGRLASVTTDTAHPGSRATASSSPTAGSCSEQATSTAPRTATTSQESAVCSSRVLYVAEEEWKGSCTTDQLQSSHQQNVITSGVDPLVGGQSLLETATICIPQNISFEPPVLSLDEEFDYGFDTTFTPISGELDPLTDEFVPRKMTPYNG
jgi:hypothetical protein